MAFDPGAVRCGYAVLEDGPVSNASGILGLHREDNGKREEYQAYKLRLTGFWTEQARRLLQEFTPELVVTEIVPAVGGGNFVVATQSQLASTVSTVIHTIAFDEGIPVRQISASRVKRAIGGVKDASKAKVRDGVIELLPGMEPRRKELTQYADEADAFAVGLCALGLSRSDKD